MAKTDSTIVHSRPLVMYQANSRMKPKSSSDRARKSPSMKKMAIQMAVTLTRNGILALANDRASVLPAAGDPSTSSTTAIALSAATT